MIDLLSCKQCNIQNVGKTTWLPLKRIHLYRRAKSDCEYVMNRFKNACIASSFSGQIIGMFPGT